MITPLVCALMAFSKASKSIWKLAALLTKKSEENGTPIFILADEPYREIAYDGVEVPYVTKYYANTLVCYSYSKSLSLPGERIGYVIVPDEVTESKTVYAAIAGAGHRRADRGFSYTIRYTRKPVRSCLFERDNPETCRTSDKEIRRKRHTDLYSCG